MDIAREGGGKFGRQMAFHGLLVGS
jgi:hypothetical protein